MTFKANWEKVDEQIQLPVQTIESMVKMAFPNKPRVSMELHLGVTFRKELNIEPIMLMYLKKAVLKLIGT